VLLKALWIGRRNETDTGTTWRNDPNEQRS
jgi:hypothetical protein